MLIGILQTGHLPDEIRAETGDYDALFHRLLDGHGFDFRTWNVVDMELPEGPGAADAWLVTGSRHGAYEAHPWIPPLEDLIRAIHAEGRPLVGICFGHQIVAQALGGRVEKHAGGWAVGRTTYDFGGRQVALNAWHQDQVVAPPPGAETVATGPDCAHAALRIGPATWTVQAHPEFGADIVSGLIEHRGGAVPEDRLAPARSGLDRPTDRAEIGAEMARHLAGRAA